MFITNTDKTELIWFGLRQILEQVSGSDRALQLDSGIIKPFDVVRDLGVPLYTELSLKQHITRIASNCFYHLRQLRQIRRVVGEYVTSQLISAFVLSRLDYCNSLLAGLPRTSVEPLQRVQNAAGRLVRNLGLRDHVKPALKQQHWLPVEHRIKYKLCTMMHQIYTGHAPQYLAHSVQSVAEFNRRPGLRSADTADYIKRRTPTKFGTLLQSRWSSCLEFLTFLP